MKKSGNIWVGILIGVIIPLIVVLLINLVLILFGKYLTEDIFQSSLLLGIGINALSLAFFFKKNKDVLSRGVMISSMLMFLFWVVRFILTEN